MNPPDIKSFPPFSHLGAVGRARGAVFARVTDPIATVRACRLRSRCIPIGWTGSKCRWSRLALPIGEYSGWSCAEHVIQEGILRWGRKERDSCGVVVFALEDFVRDYTSVWRY